MNRRKLGLGVIGCGRMAQAHFAALEYLLEVFVQKYIRNLRENHCFAKTWPSLLCPFFRSYQLSFHSGEKGPQVFF
jgi:hypothetical protein